MIIPGQFGFNIQYSLCHCKFSYMINQKFMKLCTLQDPNVKMCTLVGYKFHELRIKAKKKIHVCVFMVTRPTLIFARDPMNFYTEFG
jgi:hypothetical protein